MKWNNLTMTQRNELMKLYLKHGITSLDFMKSHYNSFDDGGYTEKPDDPPSWYKQPAVPGTTPENSDNTRVELNQRIVDNTRIDNIRNSEGNVASQKDLIEIFEGYSPTVYRDNKGILSFGYGHKMTSEEIKRYPLNSRVPDVVIDSALNADTLSTTRFMNTYYPKLLDQGVRLAIENLHYQGGNGITRANRDSNGNKTSGGAPKFEEAINNFILNPTKENREAIIETMTYKDDAVTDYSNMANRYGINRALVDGTLAPNPDSIREAKENGKYTLYRSKTGKDKRTKRK